MPEEKELEGVRGGFETESRQQEVNARDEVVVRHDGS